MPEDQLGLTLLVRNKAGTTLTSAGRQFQKQAATLVRTKILKANEHEADSTPAATVTLEDNVRASARANS
jgi:hypothetical protein